MGEDNLSRGERTELGRLSSVEWGVAGPRPLAILSTDRWEDDEVREGLAGEVDDEEEEVEEAGLEKEVLSLSSVPSTSARPRHGIFSRLTTGSDTHVLPRAPLGGYTASGALLKRP